MWNVDGMKRWFRRLPFLLVATLLFACELEDPLALGELVVDEVTGDAIYCHVAVSGMAPDDYGFYYATFFKYYRRLLAHPEVLDAPPEEVVKDID